MPAPLKAAAAATALAVLLLGCGGDDDSATATSEAVATTGASGGAEPSGAGALPTVSGAADAKPEIAIPDTEAPAALVVEVLEEGDGPAVAAGDQLTAHYVGLLWRDGSQFDASWDRGQPATFPVGVGRLIAGWDEGLVGVPYGSRVLLVVPPDKGYGPGGNPGAGITGDDTLVFVVDLLEQAG